MVDPARVVAANLRIDYFAVVEAKIECVWIVVAVGGSFPRDACTPDSRTSIRTSRLRLLLFFGIEGIKQEEKTGSKNGAYG